MSRRAVRDGLRPRLVDVDDAVRDPRGQRSPEGRPRNVAGHLHGPPGQRLAARSRSTCRPSRSTVDAERGQRPLRMIPGGSRLDDDRSAARMEARQQDAALHLGARHLGSIGDALQPGPVDGQGRPAVVGLNARPHLGQRVPSRGASAGASARRRRRSRCETDAPRQGRPAGASWSRSSRHRRAPAARDRPWRPRPVISTRPPSATMGTPSARRQASVAAQSAPDE